MPSDAHDPPVALVFFDYACPFCFLDHFRFERLRAEHPVDITLVPFELRPNMPKEGISASEHGLAHSPRVEQHIARLARAEGFEMHLPDRIPNTHDALVLGEMAREESDDRHREIHVAIFRALFVEGRDIGARPVLLDIAEEHSLDGDELQRAWATRLYDERLHAFEQIGLSVGVSATPALLVCGQLLIGSRPYAVLEAALLACYLPAEEAEPEFAGVVAGGGEGATSAWGGTGKARG